MKMNKTIFNTLSKLILTLVVLCCFYVVSMILVQYIPNKCIKDNVISSAKTLQKEEMYRQICPQYPLGQYRRLDNYTDCLMIDIAMSTQDSDAVESAMLNVYYGDDSMPYELEDVARGNTEKLKAHTYGRYWHGYLLVLKPLLVLMDYESIRLLNGLFFIVICGLCLYLISKRINKTIALLFAVLLLYFNFYIIPFSLQNSNVTYIALISVCIVLAFPNIVKDTSASCITFCVIGSLTSFFDLLSFPYLTLGIPLFFAFLQQEGKYKMKQIIMICICWIFAYAISWGCKFVVGSLLTGVDILEDARKTMLIRTSGEMGGIRHIAGALLMNLIPAIVLLCMLPVYLKNLKPKEILKKYSPILLLACITPVWFIALRNHSFVHGTLFTFRGWILPFLCVFSYMYYTIDFTKLHSKYKLITNSK